MKTRSNEQHREHRLSLSSLARALFADGLIAESDMARVNHSAAIRVHPLVYLAEQRLANATRPGAVLDMDALLAWLGKRCGQEVYEIDPLRMNVTAVAEVMSRAFAERHRILAVEVHADEVVIASSEPYIRAWENNLEHALRKPIRRVLADPRELARHTADFYGMAHSVRGAGAVDRQGGGVELGNLEQMLELGSIQEPDANDQHIVNIVDWLLQYAFDQRASDIHIEPRREFSNVRFRIDGVLHSVYQLPAQVGAAVSSRIKILGRMDLAEKRRPQDG
ncbi:MAG: Flp pilus assembly complex ATPase component TadA, partial [Halioglobus sp.]|nr:Flp pilus assembly complex ATPase component TadA [Halioglobus sp.]